MPREDVAAAPPAAPPVLAQLCEPRIARAAVLASFAVLVALAWTRNVNWDEFYFLSHVHAHLDGRLDRPLQTVFVHAFEWLDLVPGHEMGQIAAARLVMTGLLAVTCLSIFRMGAALAGVREAWIAVVAFLTSGFTLAYGASFRADPIAAAGLMTSLAIILTGRMSLTQILAVAVLSACALLVTIKAALYLPAYLAILAWRVREPGIALRIVSAGVLGLGIAGGLFALHAAGIEAPADRTAAANLQGALNTTLLESGFLPRGRVAHLWALLSLGGLALAWLGVLRSERRMRWLLLAFAAPLILSVLFYRNAFGYFFPFIAPPFMVVAAVGAARLGAGATLGALMALMLATGTGQALRAASEGAALQRATLAEVHRLFPEPVPYIDQNAMVASFPREVFFMSTWGVSHYRAEGVPVMAELISRTQPPFLLSNRWALHQAMTVPDAIDNPFLLLPEDQAALRAAYVHYSGVIWLAGRTETLGQSPVEIDLAVRGSYRLVAEAPVRIDGMIVEPGDIVVVGGPFTLAGPEGSEVTLIWDTGRPLRPDALPTGGLYAGFWEL